MSETTPSPQHTFTAAEHAWLDRARAGWAPLSQPQAVVIRRLLRPEKVERRGAA